jgi:UDP-N-acetylmuramoyl-L-alanyl-D-glutamate--2,6-diaminopimelate ligase
MRIKEFLTLQEVEEAEGDLNQEVSGLTYDSRKIKAGQLFFAVAGEKVDGHDFIGEAIRRGAAGVVSARNSAPVRSAASVRVKDVRRAMGLWSAHFFGHPSRQLKLVGVTGTNGKTTLTYLVESMLASAGMEPGVIGTINYRYRGREVPAHHTTPESLDLHALLAEMRQAGVRSVAMEVSSHALAQERVRGLEFDVAVFTNLSRDHLDYHRDMDDYFLAKSKLFTDYLMASSKARRAAVLYGEDPRGGELIAQVRSQGLEVWSYGEGSQWDVHPLKVDSDVAGLRGKIQAKERSFEFTSALIGAANLQNILGAVGVGFALGLSAEAVAKGIQKLQSVPGRLEKVENDLGMTILVDYAHTPDALEKVLGAVRQLTRGKVVTVFGCGGDRDRGKRPLMGEIAARLSDLVVLTSDNPRSEDPLAILREVEVGIRQTDLKLLSQSALEAARGYWLEADRRAAIGLALRRARRGDLVLIAGKGHEDYQILGPKRIHFDDREVAREAASQRADA